LYIIDCTVSVFVIPTASNDSDLAADRGLLTTAATNPHNIIKTAVVHRSYISNPVAGLLRIDVAQVAIILLLISTHPSRAVYNNMYIIRYSLRYLYYIIHVRIRNPPLGIEHTPMTEEHDSAVRVNTNV